jgi:hypothetical protein
LKFDPVEVRCRLRPESGRSCSTLTRWQAFVVHLGCTLGLSYMGQCRTWLTCRASQVVTVVHMHESDAEALFVPVGDFTLYRCTMRVAIAHPILVRYITDT